MAVENDLRKRMAVGGWIDMRSNVEVKPTKAMPRPKQTLANHRRKQNSWHELFIAARLRHVNIDLC